MGMADVVGSPFLNGLVAGCTYVGQPQRPSCSRPFNSSSRRQLVMYRAGVVRQLRSQIVRSEPTGAEGAE